MVPRQNKNNAYSKSGGTNKEYYGISRRGLSKKIIGNSDHKLGNLFPARNSMHDETFNFIIFYFYPSSTGSAS